MLVAVPSYKSLRREVGRRMRGVLGLETILKREDGNGSSSIGGSNSGGGNGNDNVMNANSTDTGTNTKSTPSTTTKTPSSTISNSHHEQQHTKILLTSLSRTSPELLVTTLFW